MARTKGKEPAVRVVDGKRIDLAELRRRRKLQKETAKPIEDTRISDAWARADARQASRKLDAKEDAARKALPTKQQVKVYKVDNPNFSRDHIEGRAANFRKIDALVNVQESAIGVLTARGYLHPAQVRAADRFRQLWEKAGGAGAGAMDYTREPVDGGGKSEAISDTLVAAGLELERCRKELGTRGYRLVASVAGEGRSIEEIAGQRQRDRYSLTDALRGCLEDLAVMWRYTNYAQPERTAVRK